MINFSTRQEIDILYSLKVLTEKKIKSVLLENDYNFTNCFKKAVIGLLGSSLNFQKFLEDLYSKKLKKKYIFYTYEEIVIANIILRKYRKRSKVYQKNQLIYFFKLIIFRNLLKFLILLSKILNKDKQEVKKGTIFHLVQESKENQLFIASKIYSNAAKKRFTKYFFFQRIFGIFFKKKNYFIKSTKKILFYIYIACY